MFSLFDENEPGLSLTFKGPGIFNVLHVGANLKLQIGM